MAYIQPIRNKIKFIIAISGKIKFVRFSMDGLFITYSNFIHLLLSVLAYVLKNTIGSDFLRSAMITTGEKFYIR